jgi:hypothetical protein
VAKAAQQASPGLKKFGMKSLEFNFLVSNETFFSRQNGSTGGNYKGIKKPSGLVKEGQVEASRAVFFQSTSILLTARYL